MLKIRRPLGRLIFDMGIAIPGKTVFLIETAPWTPLLIWCILVKDMDELLHPSLRWRHNGHVSVSNHQPHDCLLNRLLRCRSKKTSKLRVTGLCVGNSPGTGEFPAQMASNAENVSIWWRHHDSFPWNIIIYPYHNFNGSLHKPSLKSGYRLVLRTIKNCGRNYLSTS